MVMVDGMRATGKWAALYFILLMTIGNYILFNLLVAILVEGFANQPVRYLVHVYIEGGGGGGVVTLVSVVGGGGRR